MIVVCTALTSRPGTAWAQSGTEDILAIPVHPRMPTILHFPDALTRARVNPGTSMEVTLVGRTLHVRPDAEVPVGLEALLAVETTTMLLTFRLYVVEHVEDAREELVVVAMQSEQRAEVGPTTPSPTSQNSLPGPAHPAEELEFSLHVTTALAGVTAVEIPGYAPDEGRRSHHTLGLRLAISPRDAWWAVEGNIGGKWLDAPTVHVGNLENMRQDEKRVSGPWLEAAVGLRAGAGTRWRATALARLGLQAHLRDTETISIAPGERRSSGSRENISYGAVLTLGLGLQRQVRGILLGLDFQMQQGLPMEYRSLTGVLSVGFFLDQGD